MCIRQNKNHMHTKWFITLHLIILSVHVPSVHVSRETAAVWPQLNTGLSTNWRMRSARANRTDFLQVISKIKHRTFSIYTLQVCNEKQQITANGSIIIVKVSWWKRNPHRNPGKCYTDQINIVAVRQVLTAPPPPFHPSHPHYCTGQASLPALLQGIPSRP